MFDKHQGRRLCTVGGLTCSSDCGSGSYCGKHRGTLYYIIYNAQIQFLILMIKF